MCRAVCQPLELAAALSPGKPPTAQPGDCVQCGTPAEHEHHSAAPVPEVRSGSATRSPVRQLAVSATRPRKRRSTVTRSRAPVPAPSRSRPTLCPSSPTTWGASPTPRRTGSSSSGRKAGGCAGRTSARSGTAPGERSACRNCTSTTWAHREHDGGRAGRQPQGADVADGPLQPARRTDIYLHATRERDQKVAAGMGRLFAEAKTKSRAGTMKADDGNRTRMTSLEGSGSGPAELRLCR